MFHEVAIARTLEAEGDDDPIMVTAAESGGGVDNSIVHNVTSQSYPIVLPPSVIHSSLSIAGFITNLSSSYESHSVFCKDDLYTLPHIAHRWTIRCLAAGTICSSLPSPTSSPYYALIARSPY